MEKKTPPSKSTFEIPVTEVWDNEKQTDKQEPTNGSDTSFKNIKVTLMPVPFAEVFYVMDKNAAAQCSIDIGTTLFHS